nr:Dihydrofolate reductase [uncultured bacterium]
MTVVLIAAISSNGVIGNKGKLPWHLPVDMEHFKQLTIPHPVVMGRKTYESIPAKFRPLPERPNIVVTRNPAFTADKGVLVTHSVELAIDLAQRTEDTVFVIGGGEIYQQALPLATHIYLTRVETIVEGDTYFPNFPLLQWRRIEEKQHLRDERNKFDLTWEVYERIDERRDEELRKSLWGPA